MKTKSRWVSWRMVSALLVLPLLGMTTTAFAPTSPVQAGTAGVGEMVVASQTGSANTSSANPQIKGSCGSSSIVPQDVRSHSFEVTYALSTRLGIITSYDLDATLNNGDYETASNDFYDAPSVTGQFPRFTGLATLTTYHVILTGSAVVAGSNGTIYDCTIIPSGFYQKTLS